ncbi:MAG TPA: UDP-2,3-diacylglucosamine diphosphatase [Gammaproteobacteria bacterium]|nr:UDP-2,3-diacylglucosamine diphosphatase [Gammaproteobacteria bacterium]
MTALFISDLHLDPRDGAAVRLFTEFIEREALDASALYILGDLFEAWVGDDDDDPGLEPVLSALGRLRDAGIPCAVMHGNRDFLLGARFATATGCRLLGDFEKIAVQNEPLLLTHGDLLCTDDTRYMALRAQLRSPEWQRTFLAKPLGERRAIATDLRRMSASEIAAKAEDIMDVNQATVERTMREFGVRQLRHGHTHRPAVHRFELDGAPATRLVLGAWHDGVSVVRWDASGFRLGK